MNILLIVGMKTRGQMKDKELSVFKEGVIHGLKYGSKNEVDNPENVLISTNSYYKQGYKFGIYLYCEQDPNEYK